MALITEVAWSPIKDGDRTNIKNSPIWTSPDCYKDSEMNETIMAKHNVWYKYIIKFDGLVPVQVTGIKTIKNR